MKTTIRFVLFFVVCSVCPWSAFGETLSPEDLFQKYESQIKSFSQVTFTGASRAYDEPENDKVATFESNWKIDFDRKWYFKDHSKGQNISQMSLVDGEAFTISVSEKPMINSERIAVVSFVKIPEDHWKKTIRLHYTSFPFGYFQSAGDAISLIETIRSSQKEILQDGEKPGLLCKNEEYECKIWFDPAKDYAAEKISIRRITPPELAVLFSTCEYTVQQFESIDGRWFPVKFHVVESYTGGKVELNLPPGLELAISEEMKKPRPPRTTIADVTLSNIKFPTFSSDDFRIKEAIPDGTPVSMQDALQIEYIWMDGKAVPKTDDAMLALARGHKFMPGVSEPRFWLMAVGLVMLLVGGGILLRRHLKSEA